MKSHTSQPNVLVYVFIRKPEAINIQNYYVKMYVNSCHVTDFLVFS